MLDELDLVYRFGLPSFSGSTSKPVRTVNVRAAKSGLVRANAIALFWISSFRCSSVKLDSSSAKRSGDPRLGEREGVFKKRDLESHLAKLARRGSFLKRTTNLLLCREGNGFIACSTDFILYCDAHGVDSGWSEAAH